MFVVLSVNPLLKSPSWSLFNDLRSVCVSEWLMLVILMYLDFMCVPTASLHKRRQAHAYTQLSSGYLHHLCLHHFHFPNYLQLTSHGDLFYQTWHYQSGRLSSHVDHYLTLSPSLQWGYSLLLREASFQEQVGTWATLRLQLILKLCGLSTWLLEFVVIFFFFFSW